MGVNYFTNWLIGKPHWLLAGHLLILHALAFGGWRVLAVRLLWPVAVGLLLLWQPFVEGERSVSRVQVAVLFALVLAAAMLLGPWPLLIWCAALAAVIGGRVLWTERRLERVSYLLAFGYVVCLILFGIVPDIAPGAVSLDPLPKPVVANYMPLLLPILLTIPTRPAQRKAGDAFDFFYAVLVFLLLAVFVLGSLSFTFVARIAYLEAVLWTSFALAGALLLLAWIWNPLAGFSGMGSAFARYLLSIGMPVEQWLVHLNEESEREADPERFLAAAMRRLLPLPWVCGGTWYVGGLYGHFGETNVHEHRFEREGVMLALYFNHLPSPAMRWHFDWLLRLAAEYYLVKRQARELQRISYLQAVYETGARVTHDVKNLLQSLQTLCYAAAQPGDAEALAQLLGRQLPQIAERLKATLDKLQRPLPANAQTVPADVWWTSLRQRYASAEIEWRGTAGAECILPRELFDGVAENLLQNALGKRQSEPGLHIVAELQVDSEDAGRLKVSDDGSPLAAGLTERLFREPVPSENGLGIGLYHAAGLAGAQGYVLQLLENQAGRVVFQLAPLEAEGREP